MDFSQGTPEINMERGSSHDSGYASFQTIQEWHPGNLWSLTDDMTEVYEVDPDYHYHRISGHEAEYIQ